MRNGKNRQPKVTMYNSHAYKCSQDKTIEAKLISELERKSAAGIGHSKREARKTAQESAEEAAGVTNTSHSHAQSPSIHSHNTFQTYMQQVQRYGKWLDARGLSRVCWTDGKALAREYIQTESWKSAWTQSAARSALSKAFGCSSDDLGPVKDRRASDIKRGRGKALAATLACQAAMERNHADLCEVARSCGMRSGREFAVATAANFHEESDGLHYTIKGKGGRIRDSLVIGNGDDIIRSMIASDKSNGISPLFHIPSHFNAHAKRADYAQRAYQYALEHGQASGKTYTCRDTGSTYDTGALAWVSAQLGHGEDRHYTVAHNYLSYGKL